MQYRVNSDHDETGWAVMFPDVPEALTGGATREEALAMEQDALVTAFDFYFDDRREIPLPSSEGVPIPISGEKFLSGQFPPEKRRDFYIARWWLCSCR